MQLTRARHDIASEAPAAEPQGDAWMTRSTYAIFAVMSVIMLRAGLW